MRGSNPLGRFTIDYETESIYEGVTEDLQNPIGQSVDWFIFDADGSRIDDVYDVGSDLGGRRWKAPFTMPVVMATIFQGQFFQNERGFYTSDVLRLVVNMNVLYHLIPDIGSSPDVHLLDRFVYRDEVFQPNRIYPKGHIHNKFIVVTIDALQVNAEEAVNDPQFNTGTFTDNA